MGYVHTATHKTRRIELWQQGDITYILNADQIHLPRGSWRNMVPARLQWPGVWWMRNMPISRSGTWGHAYTVDDKCLDVPAIVGIGESLLYFVDSYGDENAYDPEYDWHITETTVGVGFYYLDHLTLNVFKGNMDKWLSFSDLFNFRKIRFFDIEGKNTGLFSRALTSPCGHIRIPINEDRGETGQIVSYLKKYKGRDPTHRSWERRHLRGC